MNGQRHSQPELDPVRRAKVDPERKRLPVGGGLRKRGLRAIRAKFSPRSTIARDPQAAPARAPEIAARSDRWLALAGRVAGRYPPR
jgi:hypothetical protein